MPVAGYRFPVNFARMVFGEAEFPFGYFGNYAISAVPEFSLFQMLLVPFYASGLVAIQMPQRLIASAARRIPASRIAALRSPLVCHILLL